MGERCQEGPPSDRAPLEALADSGGDPNACTDGRRDEAARTAYTHSIALVVWGSTLPAQLLVWHRTGGLSVQATLMATFVGVNVVARHRDPRRCAIALAGIAVTGFAYFVLQTLAQPESGSPFAEDGAALLAGLAMVAVANVTRRQGRSARSATALAAGCLLPLVATTSDGSPLVLLPLATAAIVGWTSRPRIDGRPPGWLRPAVAVAGWALAAGHRLLRPPTRRIERFVEPAWIVVAVAAAAAVVIADESVRASYPAEYLVIQMVRLGTGTLLMWYAGTALAPWFGVRPPRLGPALAAWVRRAEGRTTDTKDLGTPAADGRAGDPGGPASGNATEVRTGPDSRLAGRRALMVVLAVSIVIAVLQWRWIALHRHFGNFDIDEAGLAGAAAHLQSSLPSLFDGYFRWWCGPALPLLSALALTVGPDSAATVVAIQPLLAIATAAAAAAVALRTTGAPYAVVTGLWVTLAPATITLTQMMLPSLGAAAAITGAVWVLVSSDRNGRARTWWFGPLCACAVLFRPMTVALMPALVVAGVLATRCDSMNRRRLLGSLTVGGMVTAHWFLGPGRPAVEYVAGGLRIDRVQSVSLVDRMGLRLEEVADGLGRPVLLLAIVAGAAGALAAFVGRRRSGSPRRSDRRPLEWLRTWRPGSTGRVGVVLVLGWPALLAGGDFGSLGFWDYPLIPLLVAALMTLVGRLPRLLGAGVATVGTVLVAHLALVALGVLAPSPWTDRAMGRYQQPVFLVKNGADHRFVDEPLGLATRQASIDNWAAVRAVDRAIAELAGEGPGDIEVAFRGGIAYVRARHEVMARLEYRPPIVFVGTDVSLERFLEPGEPGVERIILVPQIDPGSDAMSGGRNSEQLERALADQGYRDSLELQRFAEMRGWTVARSVELPLGDRMLIYRGPD